MLKILADWYESSISIGSMGEFCMGMKIVYNISIEKCMGLEKDDPTLIIMQFYACFYTFWVNALNGYS